MLRNPETGRAFELYPAQIEFLRRAFTLTPDGLLKYPELVFSAPKKSGKTALGGMIAIYMAVVLGGPYAEVWCLPNDYEQAAGRVFQAAARIIQASPLLAPSVTITAVRITWPATGSFIAAVASDEKGFAGSNASLTIADELWGFTSERSRRLWDESTPLPTRKVSGRLVVSYAGFLGESDLLEGIYKRGIAGNEVAPDLFESEGTLCFWAHKGPAPWQDERWFEGLRRQERPVAFRRFALNEWTSSESKFLEESVWDAIVDPNARPIISDRNFGIYVGLDASIRHDTTAIVACAYDKTLKRVVVVAHRCFRPNGADIDFAAIEASILDLRARFNLRSVSYDPFQLVAVAQRLAAQGIKTLEFQRTQANLTQAAQTLFTLISDRNIFCYPSAEIREAVMNASIVETPRGMRLAKERPSGKIDLCAALSFACLEAVKQGAVSCSPAEMLAIWQRWFDGKNTREAGMRRPPEM